MTTATEQLTALATADNRFSHSHDDLKALQLQALNERFQARKGRIKLLAHRAAEAGITEIRSLDDMVPLLFPHTAYKSYPESFLSGAKWERMTKWLETLSPYPLSTGDSGAIADLDDWIARLEANGHYVSCTSGTTGKSAMLIASEQDAQWWRRDVVNVFAWGSGVVPAQDHRMMGLAPTAQVPKNSIMGDALEAAFGDPAKQHFRLNMPAITVGQMTQMVVLRKKMAEGTALPEELAALENNGKQRQQALDNALAEAAQNLVKYRGEKLMLSGMWSALYQIAKRVRELGYSGSDFHADNCLYVGGGLKRAQLPDDYQEFIHDTFNIPTNRKFQMYGMQEINSGMPRCQAGNRYHIPPWVVPLLLDQAGENLLPHNGGEIEGRAAFFDLSMDGAWGGVISGDRIAIDFSPCACGNASPSIRDDIARYADLKDGDDKIACSGTVDVYVRGVS